VPTDGARKTRDLELSSSAYSLLSLSLSLLVSSLCVKMLSSSRLASWFPDRVLISPVCSEYARDAASSASCVRFSDADRFATCSVRSPSRSAHKQLCHSPHESSSSLYRCSKPKYQCVSVCCTFASQNVLTQGLGRGLFD